MVHAEGPLRTRIIAAASLSKSAPSPPPPSSSSSSSEECSSAAIWAFHSASRCASLILPRVRMSECRHTADSAGQPTHLHHLLPYVRRVFIRFYVLLFEVCCCVCICVCVRVCSCDMFSRLTSFQFSQTQTQVPGWMPAVVLVQVQAPAPTPRQAPMNTLVPRTAATQTAPTLWLLRWRPQRRTVVASFRRAELQVTCRSHWWLSVFRPRQSRKV